MVYDRIFEFDVIIVVIALYLMKFDNTFNGMVLYK